MSCKDIFTDHAPLIHKAADVQTQLQYTNGVQTANIIDLPTGKNAQRLLEAYFGKVGIPQEEIPIGSVNNSNLTYRTSAEFIPGSLEVYLGGDKLDLDEFSVTTSGSFSYKEFTIVLQPNDEDKIREAPYFGESLVVKYNKRITFNTQGGT